MKKDTKQLLKIFSSAFLLMLGMIIPSIATPFEWLRIALFALALLSCGLDVYVSAVKNIMRGEFLDEKFLMSVASVGAFFIGEYSEGVAVMLFFTVGEFFEHKAVARSRKSIKALMKIRPDSATVIRNGVECEIDSEDVEVGDEIVLRAGERVPVDCVVTRGEGDVDTSAVTGESVPVFVSAGKEISGGCVNISSLLYAKAVRTCENSAASRILALVEEANERKSKQESFITAFSRYYTPIVVFSALALAVIPPFFDGMDFARWIYRALMFLVVSCPCALVISVPLSFFGGIGAAAKKGILYKGGSSFDMMKNIEVAVFDKTGTLTTGNLSIEKICPQKIGEDELLAIAASAEHSSRHPIANAVRAAYKKDTVAPDRSDEIAGQGVVAVIDGHTVNVGNYRLMLGAGISHPEVDGSCLHISRDGEYLGYLTLSDEIKTEARSSLDALRSLGVKRTVMLTGDNEKSAKNVSSLVGIDECRYSLMPQDKYAILEEEIASSRGRVVYVGDGINDAPVIARADVGVAMGNVGSDAAIEASDLVIMSGSLSKLPEAVRIARRTLRIAKENIVIAIGVKLSVLALCALGFIGMWWAVFADVGVAFIAILNAMRTLK